MSRYYSIPSLLSLSLESLTKPSSSLAFTEDFTILPPTLKDPLRKVLLKRGLSGSQLSTLLHTKVTDLDLSDSPMTHELLSALSICENLRKLNLNTSFVYLKRKDSDKDETAAAPPDSNQVAELLSKNPHLCTLYMRNLVCMTDSVIPSLPPSITHLDMGGCVALTDTGVEYLVTHCPRLVSLSLARTKISDTGLAMLGRGEAGKTLKEIRLDGCRAITDQGIGDLLAGISRGGSSVLEILIFHKCPEVTDRSRQALEEFLMDAGRAVRQLTWTVY